MSDDIEPVEDDEVHYEGRPGSLVMYRIAGRDYPMKVSNKCKVCNSPYRMQVEEEMVAGRGPSFILRGLPSDHNLTIHNIRRHFDGGHLPSDVAVVRELIEARAKERGDAIESGQATLVDGVSFMRTVMTRAFERIAKGELKIGVEHGLAAAQALEALGYSDGDFDQQNYTEAVIRYFDIAQRRTSPEVFAAIMDDIKHDPVLKALAAKERARQQAKPQLSLVESSGEDTSMP